MASRQSPRRLRIALCPSKTKPNYTSSMRIDPRSHVSERKRTRPEHTKCRCVQISPLTADRLFFFRLKPHFISIIITVSYRSDSASTPSLSSPRHISLASCYSSFSLKLTIICFSILAFPSCRVITGATIALENILSAQICHAVCRCYSTTTIHILSYTEDYIH